MKKLYQYTYYIIILTTLAVTACSAKPPKTLIDFNSATYSEAKPEYFKNKPAKRRSGCITKFFETCAYISGLGMKVTWRMYGYKPIKED